MQDCVAVKKRIGTPRRATVRALLDHDKPLLFQNVTEILSEITLSPELRILKVSAEIGAASHERAFLGNVYLLAILAFTPSGAAAPVDAVWA
jgi:hypothetical protein